MLFKRHGRSFKFCILGLSDLEHAEISNIITDNGGEIYETGHPSVITFVGCNTYAGGEPAFHVNYIRECVRQGKILDLIKFKLGSPGLYGCLMSIFTRGENCCPFIDDFGSCCSSTQIEPIDQSPSLIHQEDNYPQGDHVADRKTVTSSEMPPTIPDLPPEDSDFPHNVSLRDSEFLPDRSLQNSKLSLDKSPRDSEFLPDRSMRNSEFPLDGSPRDSEFLPDRSMRNSEFPLDGSPRDSEFLPDRSMRNSEYPLDRSPQDSEFSPDETHQCSEFRSDSSLRDSEISPAELSVFSADTVILEDEVSILRTPRTSELPEPIRFEESSYVRSSVSPDVFPREFVNLDEESSEPVFEKIIISRMQSRSSSMNLTEFYPLSSAEEETETCDNIPLSVEKEKEILSQSNVQQPQTSESETQNFLDSPLLSSEKDKRKLPSENELVHNQPIACHSRSVISPTVLKDKFNQVKILTGGSIREDLRNMEEFCLTSSDSDDANYSPSTPKANCKHKRSMDRNSLLRSPRNGSKKTASNRNRETPGSSREKNASQDVEEVVVIDDNNQIDKQSNATQKSDKNSCTSNTQTNTCRVSNYERNATVSSTRSSDEGLSISEDNSEDEVAVSSSRKALPETLLTKASSQAKSSIMATKKCSALFSRNFLPWEQREMVRYLIAKRSISESRGHRVWQQMLKDGYLTHRTYQSLNNHFRKFILPNIHLFSMKPEYMQQFKKL